MNVIKYKMCPVISANTYQANAAPDQRALFFARLRPGAGYTSLKDEFKNLYLL
jgi:hypothetical protein